MSDFTDYTSKKKLRAAHVLTDEQFAIIDNIKGFFGVAVHNEKRYAGAYKCCGLLLHILDGYMPV